MPRYIPAENIRERLDTHEAQLRAIATAIDSIVEVLEKLSASLTHETDGGVEFARYVHVDDLRDAIAEMIRQELRPDASRQN